jgi:hypothetical protein
MNQVLAGADARQFGYQPQVLSIQDVVLRPLRTPAEIEKVLHLRDEIDLSVHAAAGRQFELLEKKETSAGSSSVSSWEATGSARSVSCPLATN